MFQYLTLALFVARVLAYDINPPLAADHFASCTTRVYRRFNLHLVFSASLKSPCYPRLAAVRVELEEDLVPDQHLNPMEPHFARKITQHHLTALQRDFEQRIRQSILNDALYFWCFAIH